MDSAAAGEWGAECIMDPSRNDASLFVGKLKGLGVPSISPLLGAIIGSHSTLDSSSMSEWKPKIDSLISISSPISSHSAPVSRLNVSHDQRLFVSGSYDGTCRVWELGQVENSSGLLESSSTYDLLSASESSIVRVNDAVILEQSHAVASAASDGTLHVWRIDLASSKGPTQADSRDAKPITKSPGYSRVSGTSEIRKIDPIEGEVLSVSHFNTLSTSVLVFATQKGAIHSWDLRSEREPFHLDHSPELGSISAMSLGNDRSWIVTGTSRGFLLLWDIRFQKAVKLWHHSSAMPVSRLATSFASFPAGARNAAGAEPRPFVFAACGTNECSMFDLIDGSCRQSFRVLDSEEAHSQHQSRLHLPSLREISLSSLNLRGVLRNFGLVPKADSLPWKGPVIHAIVGSVGGFDQNYLISGGGDSHIRYWDFATPSKCFSVSGAVQQRPSYDRVDFQPSGRLMICKHAPGPRLNELESSRVPRCQQRGIARPENRHKDAILDLKLVQLPRKALVSASRDCTVRIWG
jgi:phosphoinositide-3-kinase, regulatory subunit 4